MPRHPISTPRSRLGRARRSIGARADAVRLHPERDDLVRVPAIGADREDRSDALDAALGERTGLEAETCTKAHEPSVASGAGRQLEDPGGRRVAHPEILEAGQLDADGPPEDECRRSREWVRDQQLAAEPAAERRTGDANCRDRQPEQARQLGPSPERALCRTREVQDAIPNAPFTRPLTQDALNSLTGCVS